MNFGFMNHIYVYPLGSIVEWALIVSGADHCSQDFHVVDVGRFDQPLEGNVCILCLLFLCPTIYIKVHFLNGTWYIYMLYKSNQIIEAN